MPQQIRLGSRSDAQIFLKSSYIRAIGASVGDAWHVFPLGGGRVPACTHTSPRERIINDPAFVFTKVHNNLDEHIFSIQPVKQGNVVRDSIDIALPAKWVGLMSHDSFLRTSTFPSIKSVDLFASMWSKYGVGSVRMNMHEFARLWRRNNADHQLRLHRFPPTLCDMYV